MEKSKIIFAMLFVVSSIKGAFSRTFEDEIEAYENWSPVSHCYYDKKETDSPDATSYWCKREDGYLPPRAIAITTDEGDNYYICRTPHTLLDDIIRTTWYRNPTVSSGCEFLSHDSPNGKIGWKSFNSKLPNNVVIIGKSSNGKLIPCRSKSSKITKYGILLENINECMTINELQSESVESEDKQSIDEVLVRML